MIIFSPMQVLFNMFSYGERRKRGEKGESERRNTAPQILSY